MVRATCPHVALKVKADRQLPQVDQPHIYEPSGSDVNPGSTVAPADSSQPAVTGSSTFHPRVGPLSLGSEFYRLQTVPESLSAPPTVSLLGDPMFLE